MVGDEDYMKFEDNTDNLLIPSNRV